MVRVPFNRPFDTGKEMEYLQDALLKQTSSDGEYTKKVTGLLEDKVGQGRVLLTTSGTHALEMAAALMGLEPGDEVIMPSYTFPSTANAVMAQGARPVFADIEEDTLTLDPFDVERKITPATKGIFPVHYGGISCKMDKLREIADAHRLMVIEDAAQGVNARYQGRYLGTWGEMGCYSFHATKNYSSGEGGALVVNLDHNSVMERAKIIRQKGTNRHRFLQGEINHYSWVGWGSNYAPADLLMALLCARLEALDEITALRKATHEYYTQVLTPFLESGLNFTTIPFNCQSNYHLFYIVLPSELARKQVQRALGERGIEAVTHFVPLHLSSMGHTLGGRKGQLPVTERVSEGLLRLPLYTGMTQGEREYVAVNLLEILKKGNRTWL